MKTPRLDKKGLESPEALRAFIRGLPDGVFDGHTDFETLAPGQRLAWLSQSVRFAWEARKAQSVSLKK